MTLSRELRARLLTHHRGSDRVCGGFSRNNTADNLFYLDDVPNRGVGRVGNLARSNWYRSVSTSSQHTGANKGLFPLSSFEAMAILAVDVAHQGKTVTSCVECESKSITYSMELGNYGVQFFCGDLIQRRNVNFHTLVVFLMIL
eukprot:TRINITY_DN90_c1_g1_i14.p1 TRINITY_DN90_c1_g1~~TRINITY_DN90_c1_g1_i14.p1  ORF type:complete len:144 (+),score=16.53 TRINITY_DN90_c1_g1_i14:996-1427(+)